MISGYEEGLMDDIIDAEKKTVKNLSKWSIREQRERAYWNGFDDGKVHGGLVGFSAGLIFFFCVTVAFS